MTEPLNGENGLRSVPALFRRNAKNNPSAPAYREKEFGIWQTWTWTDAASEAEAALRREAETLSRKAEIVKSKNADWLKGTFGDGVALLSPGAIVSIDAERFNRDLAAAVSGSTRAHLV